MRSAISTIALVACTSLASAADLGGPYQYEGSIKDGPIAAQYNWSGLYLGGHAGWLTGGWDGNMAYSDHNPTWPQPKFLFDDSTKSFDGDGWLGGLQVGFNRQHGSIVWGLEADISWADLNESQGLLPYPNNPPSPTWDIGMELDYFGTVRGRLGYLVMPRMLIYGTGGFAFAKANAKHASLHPNATEPTGRGAANENHFGWAAGLGAEYMLANNWTIRGEWLHIDLGKEDYHLAGWDYTWNKPLVTDSFPADLTFDVFRLGVNYKFGN